MKYVQDFLEPRLANHKASVVKKEIPDFIDVCLKYNAREGKIINGRSIWFTAFCFVLSLFGIYLLYILILVICIY